MRIQTTEDLKAALRWLQDNWMSFTETEQVELGSIIEAMAACATPSADDLKRLHAAVLDAGEDQPPSGQRALLAAADKLLSAALRLHRKCERKGGQVDAQVSNVTTLQARIDELQRELAKAGDALQEALEDKASQRDELASLTTQLQEAKQLGEMHAHTVEELRVSINTRDQEISRLTGTMEDLVNERDAQIARLRTQR